VPDAFPDPQSFSGDRVRKESSAPLSGMTLVVVRGRVRICPPGPRMTPATLCPNPPGRPAARPPPVGSEMLSFFQLGHVGFHGNFGPCHGAHNPGIPRVAWPGRGPVHSWLETDTSTRGGPFSSHVRWDIEVGLRAGGRPWLGDGRGKFSVTCSSQAPHLLKRAAHSSDLQRAECLSPSVVVSLRGGHR
jgi:hypothetical protein